MDRTVEGVVRRVRPRRVLVATNAGMIDAHVRGLLKKDGPRISAHVVAVGDRVRLAYRDRDEAW